MRADVPMGHPAVVTAPEVEARLREPVPSTQVLDRYSGVRLTQEPDDLLVSIPLLHVQSPSVIGLDSKSVLLK